MNNSNKSGFKRTVIEWGGMPQEFQSSYIPSTYVVSKEEHIIYNHGGITDYSSDSFRQWLVKQIE